MSQTPFLLTMPTYGGTLAAVRCLGAKGIPVTVAGHETLAAARWSKFTSRWVRCPPVSDSDRWLDWLVRFGEGEARHVLYASSDDVAFQIAANRAVLSERFHLYQPSIETLVRVLDKKAMQEACASLGLDVPQTWYPESEDDLPRVEREAAFPVILKARTQVLRARQNKGIVVERAEELRSAYRAFMENHRYLPGVERYFGDVGGPMIQRYFPDGAHRIYSITGFVDRAGGLSATRGAVKVFQRTRPVGLGLCFESAPVDPTLEAAVLRLCREVGHYGVFEVEFVREGDRSMVIDFNPRFYGQMGFDAARGLPLAAMVHHAAVDDAAALQASIADAVGSARGATIFTHRFVFELLLLAGRFGRRMEDGEHDRWRRWYDQNRATAADASADSYDWAPGVVHAAAELRPGIRKLRELVLGA